MSKEPTTNKSATTSTMKGSSGSRESVEDEFERLLNERGLQLASLFIKSSNKHTMTRITSAMVTVIQAELMEWTDGLQDDLKGIIKKEEWDYTLDMKLDKAKSYAKDMLKGACQWRRLEVENDKDILVDFSKANYNLLSGTFEKRINILERLFDACRAESKIAKLYSDYISKREKMGKNTEDLRNLQAESLGSIQLERSKLEEMIKDFLKEDPVTESK